MLEKRSDGGVSIPPPLHCTCTIMQKGARHVVRSKFLHNHQRCIALTSGKRTYKSKCAKSGTTHVLIKPRSCLILPRAPPCDASAMGTALRVRILELVWGS